MLKRHLYILLLLVACTVQAQYKGSGTSVFNFLDLPASSRINALGGSNVSVRDGDISMGMCNPALLGERTDKVLQLNFSYYLPGTMFGSVLYGHNFGRSKVERQELKEGELREAQLLCRRYSLSGLRLYALCRCGWQPDRR